MRNLKVLLAMAVLMVALAGTAVLSGPSPGAPPPADHWRHFDGHWSYWHEGDKRWYYTDGIHWFFHDGNRWVIYHFDKLFGREGFERMEYKVPGEEIRVVVPKHEVFKHR
jgi:hypothetical protein